MAKFETTEPQRLAEKCTVASIRITGRWNCTVTPPRGGKGCPSGTRTEGPSNRKVSSNRHASHVMARMRSLSPSDKCLRNYRRNLTGWLTEFVSECPSGGRVPVVVMKRGNTRGAKGNRLSVGPRD